MRRFLTRLLFWRRKYRHRGTLIPFDTPDQDNIRMIATAFQIPADIISSPDPSTHQSVEQSISLIKKIRDYIKRKRESARWN